MTFTMQLDLEPEADGGKLVRDKLNVYNRAYAGDDEHREFAICLRDAEGNLAGGRLDGMYGSWLHIDILWVREDAHHLGYGKRMVVEAEAAGIRRGCKHAQVDTHDFQSPEFYRKLGFKVWGVLDDLPPGYQRIFFRKDL